MRLPARLAAVIARLSRPGGAHGPTLIAQATDEGPQMSQKCDRCGPAVHALYRVARRGELYLCGHCARQLRPVLSAQGWTIWPVAAQGLEHAN